MLNRCRQPAGVFIIIFYFASHEFMSQKEFSAKYEPFKKNNLFDFHFLLCDYIIKIRALTRITLCREREEKKKYN